LRLEGRQNKDFSLMPVQLIHILLALPAFMLVTSRISGLMLTAPIFASRAIPRRIKVGFVIAVSAMLFPLVGTTTATEVSFASAVTGIFAELMIGATIGLALSMVASGMEYTGLISGQQAGMALGQVFNPNLNQQTTVVGQIYNIVFFMMFLMVGGHRATMSALLDTFDVIPLLSFGMHGSIIILLSQILTGAMVLATRLSGPVLIAIFLLTLTMGFVSRTMPQMNVLSIGFNLRALVMLGVAGATITFTQDLLLSSVTNTMDNIRNYLGIIPTL